MAWKQEDVITIHCFFGQEPSTQMARHRATVRAASPWFQAPQAKGWNS